MAHAVISRRPNATTDQRPSRSYVWLSAAALPAALVVLALALRLYRLSNEPLWLDEGYTLLFSRMPLDRLISVGGAHEHPPLYYLLVHSILSVHDSYLVPRVMSSVFGSLTVLAIFLLGLRLGGQMAATIAAALVAVAPLHVFYSQDGRGYELAGLLVVLSYLALFAAVDGRNRGMWVLYGVSLALCLYSEYTTIFVLIPQAMLLVRAWKAGNRGAVLWTVGGAALAFAPWLGVLLRDASSVAGDYWIPMPSPQGVATTFLGFMGIVTPCESPPCSGHEIGAYGVAGHEILLGGLLLLAMLGAGVLALRRRSPEIGVLVLWMLVPFVIVLLLSIRRSLYLDRVFLDASFPLYLLIGMGVAGGRTRAPRIGMLVLAVAIAAIGVVQLRPIYAGGLNPDWKSLGRDLGSAYIPGPSVVFHPGVLRTLMSSYLPRGWHATHEIPVWSRNYLDVPGWQKRYPQPANPTKAQNHALDARLRNVQLADAARSGTVWLVTFNYSGMSDTRRWFAEHGFQNALSEVYSGDARLELWIRHNLSSVGQAVVKDDGLRGGWTSAGRVTRRNGVIWTRGSVTLTHRFRVTPGTAYSVDPGYRGVPGASKPLISIDVFDASGKLLGAFPQAKWYDWPVNGVWLSQPFGFVAPPGASRAVLTLHTRWGMSAWRHVAVYAFDLAQ